MAKPSTPSRASRNAPQRKVHRYIDALFVDDFGRQSKLTTTSANSFARKKVDRASQALQLHNERAEKKARRIEIREWRAAARSLEAELRESDHRIQLMWCRMQTRVRPEKKVRHKPPPERKRHWPYAAVALPKYDGPVIDRRGQRGVFMRVRYYSRRTTEAGVSQRVVKYCFNGAELDPDGNRYVATNIGATIDETLCGFDHLEQVNWSAAKNAKLLMHGILAVDHRQSPDGAAASSPTGGGAVVGGVVATGASTLATTVGLAKSFYLFTHGDRLGAGANLIDTLTGYGYASLLAKECNFGQPTASQKVVSEGAGAAVGYGLGRVVCIN